MSKIANVKGVSSSGTVAQASRFHDDKSMYTGSHAAGGRFGVFCSGRTIAMIRGGHFWELFYSAEYLCGSDVEGYSTPYRGISLWCRRCWVAS